MEKQRKAPANDKAKTKTGRKQKVKEMNMPEMSGRRKRRGKERKDEQEAQRRRTKNCQRSEKEVL